MESSMAWRYYRKAANEVTNALTKEMFAYLADAEAYPRWTG